jgi:hypothetical protein
VISNRRVISVFIPLPVIIMEAIIFAMTITESPVIITQPRVIITRPAILLFRKGKLRDIRILFKILRDIHEFY